MSVRHIHYDLGVEEDYAVTFCSGCLTVLQFAQDDLCDDCDYALDGSPLAWRFVRCPGCGKAVIMPWKWRWELWGQR